MGRGSIPNIMLSYPKEKIRVVLLEGIHPSAETTFRNEGFTQVEWFTSAFQGEALKQKIKDAHIVGIRSTSLVDHEVMEAAENLLAIGCFSVGTNQVDLKSALKLGIPVFNDPYSNTRSVAELVVGFISSLMRGVTQKNAAAHRGEWHKSSKGAFELRGKTVGIVGYGRVGSQVSILCEGLGMQVIYYDAEKKLPFGNAKSVDSLKLLLKNADIVSLHVPELSSTFKMIGKAEIAGMKPGAFLINTSRGTVVDEQALKEALIEGVLGGAALDVYEKEPSHNDEALQSSLRNLSNVILTPHIGGSTEEAQEGIAINTSYKLIRFVNQGETVGAVNFPELALPANDKAHRILHVHENIPGMLSKLNQVFSEFDINVLSQYLRTLNEIGYVVLDIEKKSPPHLLRKLKAIEGTIRTRILY